MTQTLEPPTTTLPPAEPAADRPRRRGRRVPRSTVIEMVGSAVAAFALVWLTFTVAGIVGPLGFAFCFLGVFFAIYTIICWLLYGVLAMKDRLATVAIWSGALAAFIPLVGVILYVVIKGAAVVFADFPHFFIADMSGLTATSPVTAVGAGAAIVGTIEQVGSGHSHDRPPGRSHRHLPGEQPQSVCHSGQQRCRRHDRLTGHHRRPLHLPPVGGAAKEAGQTGFAAALALSVMMLPIVTRASQEVIAIVPGFTQGSGPRPRIPPVALSAPRDAARRPAWDWSPP